jgi:dephospho-CoA kinase
MIKIGILGDIGSGKSFVAQNFGYPVFNADQEVAKLYQQNKDIFRKLKRSLPNYIDSFPIDKEQVINAILADKNNLKKIIKIVHTEIKKKLNNFLKKNKNKKIIILDIPLLLENKINKKDDILVYVQSNKSSILKKLKQRKNFNLKLLNKFISIQYSSAYKKKKSHFILKNNFTKKSVNDGIKIILEAIE